MGNVASENTAHRPRRGTLVSHVLKGVRDTGREIGHGSFATVTEVEYQSHRYAAKKLHTLLYEAAQQARRESMVRDFEAECSLLSKLDHPSIVRFIGIYFERGSELPILVMEYVPSTLSSCLNTHGVLADILTYGILRDVALGLSYLHDTSPPVIHRDLSANNILLTSNMNAKISDLGVAKILDLVPSEMTQPSTAAPGTKCYMSPESMLAQPKYTTKLDVFSYGVLMIHMLTAEWPIPSEVFREDPNDPNLSVPVTELDRRAKYICKIREDHPLMDQIKLCLHNSPIWRPEIAGVLDRIEEIIAQLPPVSSEKRLELVQKIVSPEKKQIKQKMEAGFSKTLVHGVKFDLSAGTPRGEHYNYITPPPSHSRQLKVIRQMSEPVQVHLAAHEPTLSASLKEQVMHIGLLPAWQTMCGLSLPTSATFESTAHHQGNGLSDLTEATYEDNSPEQPLSSRSPSPSTPPSPPLVAQSLPLPSKLNDSPFTRKRAIRVHRARTDQGSSPRPLQHRPELTSGLSLDSSSGDAQSLPLIPQPWQQSVNLSDLEQVSPSEPRQEMSPDRSTSLRHALNQQRDPDEDSDDSDVKPRRRNALTQERKYRQSYFSKVFSGCPLHLNCAATWSHPTTDLQYILLAAEEGLFSLMITNNPEPTLEQVSSNPCHWLQVMDNVLVWLSGHSRIISTTNLILLFQSPQPDKTLSLRRNAQQHTQKISDSKGCTKCCLAQDLTTDTRYLIAAVPRGILLMQWYWQRLTFMNIKLHKCRLPSSLSLFQAVVHEDELLPRVCVGVQKGPEERVLFKTINLNSPEASRVESKRAEDLPVVNMQQLERDTIFIGFDHYAKFVDHHGNLKLKTTFLLTPMLMFDHKSEDMVCLSNCVMSFHRHGMQVKSFTSHQVTAGIADRSKVFHLLGHFGAIIVETRQIDDTTAPSNLYILESAHHR